MSTREIPPHQNQTPCFFVECFSENKVNGNTDALNGYVYWIQRWPAHFTSTLGIGYETLDQNELEVNKTTPKIGLDWHPWESVRIRAAAVSTVKRALTANQTIEPTQVAGFNQLFDDLTVRKLIARAWVSI